MKAVVAAFNQEKALVGSFSVITNLRMELFEALVWEDAVLGSEHRRQLACPEQEMGNQVKQLNTSHHC